jgi:hypothetical protein
MTAYVEECRQEWKRLGVPDRLAEEMATELESDLAEAQADGVSATEILGESDPRRFAATWASERGLVAEPAPPRRRRHRWILIVVGLVVLFLVAVIVAIVGLFAAASVSVQTSGSSPPSPPVRAFALPNLVGLQACHARRIALRAGVQVQRIPSSRCHAVVIHQSPGPHQMIPFPQRKRTTVTFRLRG